MKINYSAKNNYATIRFVQNTLQKRKCQNCNERNKNRYDLDLSYNQRKYEFPAYLLLLEKIKVNIFIYLEINLLITNMYCEKNEILDCT